MKKIFSFLLLMLVVVYMYAAPPPERTDAGVNPTTPGQTLPDVVNLNDAVAREANGLEEVIYADRLPAETNRLFAGLSPALQEDPGTIEADTGGIIDFLKINWATLLIGIMVFLKIVVNLTPTKKDNQVFSWLDSIFNLFIPNYKDGGGTHPT